MECRGLPDVRRWAHCLTLRLPAAETSPGRDEPFTAAVVVQEACPMGGRRIATQQRTTSLT